MSTTTEHDTTSTRAASQRLRAQFIAARVSFVWLGVRKTLSSEQKAQAADTFGAEGAFLSAGKKLLDTKHAAYKGVTAVRGRILQFWRSLSLPYPEPGIRLIRQADLNDFNGRMEQFAAELDEAVTGLDERYAELRSAARERLGSLYNPDDYPASLRGMFEVAWEFPAVEPPAYLLQLNPELYEQECARIAGRFDDAVQLAEQAFQAELTKLVEHLAERLTGSEDGKPKVFRDSAIGNLTEFFERFKTLNVRSSEQLDQLVERAQQVIRGIEPQDLRDSNELRQQVAAGLSGVQSVLDGLMVDRPRRNILRRPK